MQMSSLYQRPISIHEPHDNNMHIVEGTKSFKLRKRRTCMDEAQLIIILTSVPNGNSSHPARDPLCKGEGCDLLHPPGTAQGPLRKGGRLQKISLNMPSLGPFA